MISVAHEKDGKCEDVNFLAKPDQDKEVDLKFLGNSFIDANEKNIMDQSCLKVVNSQHCHKCYELIMLIYIDSKASKTKDFREALK